MTLIEITVCELDELLAESIAERETRTEAFDERFAIQHATAWDGLTTAERALAALQRAERFSGEHDCARAHLRDCGTTAGIFTRREAA